jgi:hypothetical protein
MLIATVESWALAGVAGVAMTAALILFSVGRLLPEKHGNESWLAWLVIGSGAAIGFAGILSAGVPFAVGEALVLSGLGILALILEPRDQEDERQFIGWSVVAAVVLCAASLLVPPIAWRGIFGLALFLTAVWLATRSRAEERRPVFDLAVTPIAFAGIGLMLGVIRPSFADASDAAIRRSRGGARPPSPTGGVRPTHRLPHTAGAPCLVRTMGGR